MWWLPSSPYSLQFELLQGSTQYLTTKFYTFQGPRLKILPSFSFPRYKIVFFTNQAGIEKKKTNAKDLKLKITNIIKKLGLDIQVFVSTGENHFRKPSTKVWEFMVEKCNQGVAVDMEKSYFVGDAAGRAKGWMAGEWEVHFEYQCKQNFGFSSFLWALDSCNGTESTRGLSPPNFPKVAKLPKKNGMKLV